MKRLRALGLICLTAMGCGETPTGSLPGVLDVVLAGPAAEAGAFLFHVEGGPVDSVAAAGAVVVSAPFTGVRRRVLVVGEDLGGVVARVYVPDVSVSYRMSIVEVANARTYALMDTTRFALPFVVRRF